MGSEMCIRDRLHNTLPQAQVVTALLGQNEQYKDMAQRDPAAATRFLASGLTIPMLWRELNVDQEVMKAELARQAAQDKVRNEALKTGDWSEALNYPSLAEYLSAVEQLTPEQRAPYQPLTREQIAALANPQENQQLSQQLPDFSGVAPFDETLQQMMQATGQRFGNSPLLTANLQGRTLPGSSLTNTIGGI